MIEGAAKSARDPKMETKKSDAESDYFTLETLQKIGNIEMLYYRNNQ